MKTFVRAFIDRGGFPFDVAEVSDEDECEICRGRGYKYELKGEALESYNELMDELERGVAKKYPNFQAILDELGL